MVQTTKDRIKLFIAEKGISQKKFEEAANLSNGYVNNLKASPSSAVLQKIFYAFPEINREWLTSGQGEMLSKSAGTSSKVLAKAIVNRVLAGRVAARPATSQVRSTKSIPQAELFSGIEVPIPNASERLYSEAVVKKLLDELAEVRKQLSESIEANKELTKTLLTLFQNQSKE